MFLQSILEMILLSRKTLMINRIITNLNQSVIVLYVKITVHIRIFYISSNLRNNFHVS